MKLYKNKNKDNWLTPTYAVEIISRYLKPKSKILCPFDTENSNYVVFLRSQGHEVAFSHISEGKDFFTYTKEQVKDFDYIISNPPFSLKTQVITKLKELDKDFAMLLPIPAMLETPERQKLFKELDLKILHPNKRTRFYSELEQRVMPSPTFTSGYICRGILKERLVFDTFRKEVK